MAPPVTDRQSSLPSGAILSEQGSRIFFPNPSPASQPIPDELSSAHGDESSSWGCLWDAVRNFFLWLFCCGGGEENISWDVSRGTSRNRSLSDESSNTSPVRAASRSTSSVSLSPLHDLLSDGQYETVLKSLNERGNAKEESDGLTLLHAACRVRYNECGAEDKPKLIQLITLLLSKGVDINAQDGHYGTALHRACEHASYDVVELLLKNKPDLEIRSPRGRTVLHSACHSANVRLVRQLLDAKASVTAGDALDRTALHLLCSANHIKKEDASRLGAKSPTEESSDLTILKMLAVQAGFNDIINSKSMENQTPLEIAKSCGKNDLVEALKKLGAIERKRAREEDAVDGAASPVPGEESDREYPKTLPLRGSQLDQIPPSS